MIKTIKVKKNLRLDELIKYVRENYELFKSTRIIYFISDKGSKQLEFYDNGSFETNQSIDIDDDTFTVEVDKEITKNTPFEWLVAVNSYGSLERYEVSTITDVLSDEGADCFVNNIYALIGNNLELIWEAE